MDDDSDSPIVIPGVDIEHQVFPKPGGGFMFIAVVPDAPPDLTINGWMVFEGYPNVAAVKAALLALEAGADPVTV